MAYAWPNTGLICGQCHHMMHCEMSKNDIPVEFRAQCYNGRCENLGKLFRVEPTSAIQRTEITDSTVLEELSKTR